MEFEKFMAYIEQVRLEKTYYLRWGQTAMNVLHRLYPHLYEEVTGTEIDPFYVDDNINAFYIFLLSGKANAKT